MATLSLEPVAEVPGTQRSWQTVYDQHGTLIIDRPYTGRELSKVVTRWGECIGYVDADKVDGTWRAYRTDGSYICERWSKGECLEILADGGLRW